ncbi:hypothetical protein GHK78_25355 [Sinorhizobium meliloti]|uniref:Uncharacterized protein n=1 Tax=Sinorhizobium kummerowiae TaxID=158892 RepID=A0ABY8TBE3_9HYPH|nr:MULTISPECIES: hypothetical protein [Sinorhizobium]ASP51877.1 hypothetical protein CDO31_10145 [Sinorhizobium meliloti]MDW9444790.1 hypothetical protein [Sinorhizobium meliloti]MDW9630357.1 hypothetical protein [Sinorhizobium meliloti]MQX66279.1 hypothetical protein [Sinorhizobium meliloti]MQX89112.1 hypothetical protein [Sinorhizobium meliloti]
MTDSALTNDDEILYRQIHPTFMMEGQLSSQPFMPTSQAFAPTPKDENKLSVDRSTITSAAESFELFKSNGHSSAAVYGVTVGEFGTHDISCVADPLEATNNQEANPAHAVADYSKHGPTQQKNKAKRLKQTAIARGKLHP